MKPIGDCAIVYEECEFKGRFYSVCESIPQVEFEAKSFYVPEKKKLTLFNLKGYEGQSAIFTKTVNCLD